MRISVLALCFALMIGCMEHDYAHFNSELQYEKEPKIVQRELVTLNSMRNPGDGAMVLKRTAVQVINVAPVRNQFREVIKGDKCELFENSHVTLLQRIDGESEHPIYKLVYDNFVSIEDDAYDIKNQCPRGTQFYVTEMDTD